MKTKVLSFSLLVTSCLFFLTHAYGFHDPKLHPLKGLEKVAFAPADSSLSVKLGQSQPLIRDTTTLIVNLGTYKQLKYIKVYDVIGKKILFQLLPYNRGIVKINLKSLKPGIYFCSLYSSKGLVETRKVINF